MATNKNQHFVPRCYLRQFAVTGVERAINVYNIDRDALYPCASLADQCSGDYFYGKDPHLEKAIQTVEDEYASTVRRVLAPRYVLSDSDAQLLKVFWLFQRLRTEAAARRAVELHETIETDLQTAGRLFKSSIRDAVQIAMRIFLKHISTASDLRCCLIRNNSEMPFVTSDDPAAWTNRWHLHNSFPNGFGLQNSGLLLLLPLNPSVLFVAYDSDVHSFAHHTGWVTLRAEDDADAFNQHQYLNCRANIFIKDAMDFPKIQNALHRASPNRLTQHFGLRYFRLADDDGAVARYSRISSAEAATESNLVQWYQQHPSPLVWPRQLRWRNGAHAYFNGSAMGYVRKAFTQNVIGDQETFAKVPLFFRR